MSEYSSLKATINANVKTNGNQEITGAITNSVLNAMVDSLGAGYQFIGVATPTNPGTAQTPDYKCFYIATTPGTYANLGGLVVADGEVALLKYDTSWTKEVTGIATADQLNQLIQAGYTFAGVANTATNPGTPTSKVFWISYGVGVHQYFGNYNAKSPLTIFYWDNNSNWAAEDIGREMTYTGTPFVNKEIQLKRTQLNAIRDIRIFTKDASIASRDFSIRYLWKDLGEGHNWYIEIDANGSEFKSWNVNNYVPESNIENIVLYKNSDTHIIITIDWSKLASNSMFDGVVDIKRDRIFLINENGISYSSNSIAVNRNVNDAIINAYVIPESVYDLSTIYYISYFWKNHSGSTFIQLKKSTLDGVDAVVKEFSQNGTTIGKQKIELGNAVIYIDWDKVTDDVFAENLGLVITARYEIPIDEANDGYAIKDTTKHRLEVDQSGFLPNSYPTISAAVSAVVDSNHQNQYEIFVAPGTYIESNIVVPPYTHIMGSNRNSVLVTSKGISGSSPVFEQKDASSKLSNMTIESHTGYCIHIDIGLDKKTVYNENIHFKKYLTNGGVNSLIGGGSFQLGTLFEFKNCKFEGCAGDGYPSELGVHTQGFVNLSNTTLRVIGCEFVNAFVNVGSVGSFGKNLCEISGCRFDKRVIGAKYWLSLDGKTRNENPQYFLANKMEWDVVGENNFNLCPNYIGSGDAVCIESNTAVSGQKIEISGSIVDALFGIPEYHIGGNTLKAKAIGIYLIKDEQVANKDIYQMWKRLGDCSGTNKTLSVSLNGGAAQTVTLTENYLTSKKTESEIMAQINAQLNGVEIKKYILNNYFDHVHLIEIAEIKCTDDNDVLQYCIVDANGKKLAQNATSGYYGIALADAPKNEYIRVWTGKSIYLGITDGDYAIDADGKLVLSASNVIGSVSNGIFTFA